MDVNYLVSLSDLNPCQFFYIQQAKRALIIKRWAQFAWVGTEWVSIFLMQLVE